MKNNESISFLENEFQNERMTVLTFTTGINSLSGCLHSIKVDVNSD